MKILLLAPQPFYQERGTPIAVDLVLRTLSARGEEVDVLTYHEGAPVEYPGVRLLRIPWLPFVRGVGVGPSVKKLLCDAVFVASALRLAARTSYDVVHAVEESVFVALIMKRLFRLPYLYDMDSSMAEQLAGKYLALRVLSPGLRGLERLAIRHAGAVVPMCESLAEVARGAGARKVVVLRDISLLSLNGSATQASRPRPEELNVSGPLVMYVGNFERYQGMELLLRSFAIARRRVPTTHLVLIGGTAEGIRRYEAMIRAVGLDDCVHFLGPRPIARIAEFLNAATILVSPRLAGGNTPMKIYSYLHSGKAVLATDLPTHTQVLTRDVSFLAAPTPEAFADGMVRLLEDAVLRRRLGDAGRTLAEQRHSYPSFQTTLDALYTDIEREIAGRTSPTTTATAQNRAGGVRTVSLRAGISIALLWLILCKLDLHMVGALLRRIDWRFALAASSLYMVNRWIATVEWRLLLQAKGLRFSFRRLLRLVWIGNLFGHFLPAGVGGDSVRLVTMARERQPLPEIASSLLIERLNGALSLAALAVLGALWSYQYWKISTVAVALVLPLFAVVIAALLLWTTPGDRLLTRMVEHLRWLPGHQFFLKMHAAVKAYRRQPRAVAASFLLSEFTQVNRVAAIFLLAKALGMTLFIGEAFVLAPTALFISMLPISIDGIGVGEGAFVLLLGPAGIGAPGAFALALLARVAKLLSFLPAAPSFLVNGLRGLPVAAEGLEGTPAETQEIRRSSGQRLRVLRVIDRLGYGDRLHGAGRVWLNTLPAFDHGCEVIPCVLRLPERLEAHFIHEGIRLRHLKKGRFNPSTVVTLCRLIRRERVDVLHLEGYGASTFGRIAGILTGTPAIIHLHDMYGATPWYVRWCDWWLAPATARAVAVSEGIAEACATRLHIPRERIAVIPNAIPVGWVQPVAAEPLAQLRRALRIPQGSRVIGTVAHLQEEKDVPSLIGAVAHLRAAGRDCHVIVVGEGPDRAAIEQQIARLGLTDRVHLVGFQPDVRPYLTLMEVAVFSSVSEGCPNTLLEAMAMGRPIVATAAWGIRELMRDGENGLLVPVRDAQAIAQAVGRLLADPALAARLAAQVKRDAEAYQTPTHVKRIEALYETVVSARRRSSTVQSTRSTAKILHLCDKLAVDGGVAGIARFLSLAIPRHVSRFESVVYTLRREDPGREFLRSRGILAHPLSKNKFDPMTLVEVVKIIRREKPALIHTHGFASSNFGRLASWLTATPVLVEENFCYQIPPYQRLADRLLSLVTSTGVAVSEATKTFMVQKRFFPADRVEVVYRGIALEDQESLNGESSQASSIREAYRIPADHAVVSIVGRLHHVKGQQVVLQAAPEVLRTFPRVTFLFAGEGAERSRLETTARALRIDANVRFVGFISDVARVYDQTDIVVIPSLSEAFPNAALEGMKRGCPILASRVDGLAEMFHDGEDALLVPPNEPRQLAEKLLILLQDGQLRARLARCARATVQRFSITHTVRRFEEIYEEVLSGHGA